MCVCVCVLICMYSCVCTCSCVCVHTHVCIHVYVHGGQRSTSDVFLYLIFVRKTFLDVTPSSPSVHSTTESKPDSASSPRDESNDKVASNGAS